MDYFKYWIPILTRQYFKMKLQNDTKAIIELEDEVWKNNHLNSEEKRKVLKQIRGER
ncbi:MAG TPA: hypothetical protein IAB27_05355 [Candidatus Coprosoma intestinipullorum]|uniref:Uncharacterized protein n=1 Tax=Candidatus Coprosoma intestinipullorum TaxID=2840752 RepID=A0A9D0ZTE1_9FIRM|nr:hypothetical protein [Candidatus Coprosoma intestinipullorum]